MRHSRILYTILAIGIIITAYCIFSTKNKPTDNNPTNTSSTIVYKNKDYSFSFTLPRSWVGYSIVPDDWEGYSLAIGSQGQVISDRGPIILIRHPQWKEDAPRQDIPIMVFSLNQWSDLQFDKFHIGAAPINPAEIGRNKKFVFAIPARYNFAFPTGYEEVDQILKGNPLQSL